MVFGWKKNPAKNEEAAENTETAKKERSTAMAEEEGVKGEQAVEPAPAPATPNTDQPSPGQRTAPPFTTKMVTGPPAEEIYIDGISSLFFRANVVKLDCYRVVGQDPK